MNRAQISLAALGTLVFAGAASADEGNIVPLDPDAPGTPYTDTQLTECFVEAVVGVITVQVPHGDRYDSITVVSVQNFYDQDCLDASQDKTQPQENRGPEIRL